MKPKIVYVEWRDAVSTQGWEDLGYRASPAKCTTVGFLVKNRKKYVTIAATFAKSGIKESNNRISIPSDWISSMREIDIEF